jgi:hypothetical protein
LVATEGNATETGGSVAAAGLIINAGNAVTFNAGPNAAATLAGTASGGTFQFVNGAALTVGGVPQVVDVAPQSGITAPSGLSADALIQTNNAGQQLTLASNIAAGGRVIFDSAGPFRLTGTVTVNAPVLVVDTTGDGLTTVLGAVPPTNVSAGAIANLPPTGRTSNAIRFDNLIATNAVTLLVADMGSVIGNIAVRQLGLSGSGGSAMLTGSVQGIPGPGAAAISIITPRLQNQYLLNNCVIGSPNCILLPPVVPVQPQLVNELEVLTLRPQLDDPDAPIINIFDEFRLCNQSPEASPSAREACP